MKAIRQLTSEELHSQNEEGRRDKRTNRQTKKLYVPI
jgi:hypothetical protein